jgi:hypothetical protein
VPTGSRPTKPLVVAVTPGEPSFIKNKDGTWTGFCVESWKRSPSLDLKYELKEIGPGEIVARRVGTGRDRRGALSAAEPARRRSWT